MPKKQPTHVRVRHSDGRVWECPVRALPHYREKGWAPVDEQKPRSGGGKKTAAMKTAARRPAKKTSTPKKKASSNTPTPNKPAGD